MPHRLRAVIYARYSNEKSREASIPDQVRVCRQLADREDWEVIAVFQDAAISGASSFRAGYESLIAQARLKKFDIVIAESLDRLSRDQADVAGLYKNLSFADVQIWTLSEGRVNELHVGLKGTMNALFLKDLAAKTHRGLRGRVEAGKAGGGLSYGYSVVRSLNARGELLRGERSIHAEESVVVRKIFAMFAAGKSPIWIARSLNADGVAGPGGRPWQDTTIRGHAVRGTGILRNELYVGRLVWNRMRYVKDPDNGRRISRMNAIEQLVTKAVPELRIIEDGIWDLVQSRLGSIRAKYGAAKSGRTPSPFWEKRRPKHLLTGKLFCGSCGGALGNVGKDYLACMAAKRQGNCSNRVSIKRSTVENMITSGLRHRLMDPVMFQEFTEAFEAESNRAAAETKRGKGDRQRELARVRLKLDKLVDAVALGLKSTTIQSKLVELENQEAELTRDLELPLALPVRLAPDLAGLYHAEIDRLTVVQDGTDCPEDRELIRGLIDRVTVMPATETVGFSIELAGDIVAMIGMALNACSGRELKLSAAARASFASSVKVVAGIGFEPMTFRL